MTLILPALLFIVVPELLLQWWFKELGGDE